MTPEVESQLPPPADPFTLASVLGTPFAECDAYRGLVRLIRRYALGELSGQSCLVAGHRGIGKTTVALRAIQRVQWDWGDIAEGDGGRTQPDSVGRLDRRPARPFSVYLHGPDLLRVTETGRVDDYMVRQALAEIVEALHRAVCKEFTEQFRRRLTGVPDSELELAHKLRLELDGFPTVAELREYWETAGLLGTGIFPVRPELESEARSALPHDWDQDQAMRELVALSSLGVVRRTLEDGAEPSSPRAAPERSDGAQLQGRPSVPQTERQRNTFAVDAQSQETALAQQPEKHRNSFVVVPPLVSLASGAAVAVFGVESQSLTMLGAAIAGAATAASTFLFLRYATEPLRGRSLLPRFDVPSLNGCLPVLVERISHAGLVPIFVVDELDKVPDLEGRMERLMASTKTLVSDKAFFCFLTDREYFERLERRIRRNAYPTEAAYFDQRFLVHYTPSDLYSYLSRII